MARLIIWTQRAQKERIEISKYWISRTNSIFYSKKLNELLKDSLRLISKYPSIGKLTDKENIRVKVLRNFLIFYEITENEIVVLSLWDCRQNPEDLTKIIK